MKHLIFGLATIAAAPAVAQEAERLHLVVPLGADSEDYPRWAIEHGLGGRSILTLEVGPDGRVRKCEVFASSGYASLDARACAVYRSRGQFNLAAGADVRIARAPFLWVPEDGAVNDPLHVFGRFAADTGVALGASISSPVFRERACKAIDADLELCRLFVAGSDAWLGPKIADGASLLVGAKDGRVLSVRLGFTGRERQRAAGEALRARLGAPCYAPSATGPWGWRNGTAYAVLGSTEVSVFAAEGDPEVAKLIEARCPPLSR
ncbi:TonB family protein [Sphingomonas kyeonggiensis]|uniref:TonB family protein n=1 Tax=Sphingomonas kyeonggiensis TaxID=1268553 RepID=UPI00278AD681|nr:TonB family protein [Sphingomonas kyeonggiensis]MDQ0250540.1 TonB family protein [Sphingomonas kyeonggiensis]